MARTVRVALLLAAALAATAMAADPQPEACEEDKAAFLGLYAGMTTTMAPSPCFNATAEPEHVSHTILCSSQQCLSAFEAAHQMLQQLAPCEALPGFVYPVAEATLFSAAYEASKTECNQCIIKFEEFKRVNESWTAAGCPAKMGTADVCSEPCKSLAHDLFQRWTYMLPDGLCRQYSPGGCGDMGGMTEGDVYDALQDMYTWMMALEAVQPVCSKTCGPAVLAWYTEWGALMHDGAGGCLQTSAGSVDQYALALGVYAVSVQCDDACQESASALTSKFHKIGAQCAVGITVEHKDQLVSAMHPSLCPVPDAWYSAYGWYFAVTAMLLVVGIVAYFVVELRARRNRTGAYGGGAAASAWACFACCRRPKYSLARSKDDSMQFALADEFDDEEDYGL